MKKLLILIPILLMAGIAGVAFSKAEPAEKGPTYFEKRVWEGFPRSGLRLGLVMDETDGGLRVNRVVPGSPAEKAGIQEDDVILSIDGKKVENPRDLREVVTEMEEPREVELQLERNGQPMTVKVLPEKRDLMMMGFGSRLYLGVSLQELDADLASYFQVDPNSGVLITRVEPESPAAKAGIRSGDIITHLNGVKVNESSNVTEKLSETEEGAQLEITILRHGSEQKVSVKPENRGWQHPEIPPMPELRHMLREDPEFREEMENLRREMENLKGDLNIRKEDLQKMKEEIQRKMREEMEELRKELRERKDET